MRIVVALGGNALLRRGQPLTAEAQRENVRTAAKSLAAIADGNELVITHGNGPQVGLLALQGAAYKPDELYPLDVLGAETEGMIGYMIEQELGNLMPMSRPFASLLTMIEVSPEDPAFQNPTKFIGPVYEESEARRLADENNWSIKQDGDKWRRVVPSPLPRKIFESRPIHWLLEHGTIVICAGGGGIPTMYNEEKKLVGVEAVIDKDFASELLARDLKADLFIMATDADAVYLNWGQEDAKRIKTASADHMTQYEFPAGSMGPKVGAACQFVNTTGAKAAIGDLSSLASIVAGEGGTIIANDAGVVDFYEE